MHSYLNTDKIVNKHTDSQLLRESNKNITCNTSYARKISIKEFLGVGDNIDNRHKKLLSIYVSYSQSQFPKATQGG